MTGYLISFLVYTLAMVGVLFVALFVFKNFSNKCFSKSSTLLRIEDSMSLAPRKTLYVVNAQNEKFLIASDADRTTLISKLDNSVKEIQIREDKSTTLKELDGVASIKDFTSVVDFRPKNKNEAMMRSLANKLHN